MTRRPPYRHGQHFTFTSLRVAAFALALTLLATPAAFADAIKLGTLWVEGVTIDQYIGTELHYLVNGTPNKQFLTQIDGFKMSAYPQLDEAEKALKANNHKEALSQFKAVRGKAKEAWLRMWLDAKLVGMMDKEGENLAAVNTYISLIEAKAPAKFLEVAPFKAAAALSKEDKTKVHEKFKSLRAAAKDKDLITVLDELVDKTSGDAAPVTPNTTPGTADDLLETQIPMPDFMRKGQADQITRLLARGRFDQALERANEELKTAGGGKTSLLLYQRGLAQFYLAAEVKKDASKAGQAKAMFEDAGLSFYRVPTYFKNSPYVHVSLMETAAVHMEIGRADIARGLLESAKAGIDKDDKMLYGRLEKLEEQLAATANK